MTQKDHEWTTLKDPDIIHRRLLGYGGYGIVHELQNLKSRQVYRPQIFLIYQVFARKFLSRIANPIGVHNELDKIKRLCQKNQQHIVSVFGSGNFEGHVYFDMELCNCDLDTYNKARFMVSLDSAFFPEHVRVTQIWSIMSQVVTGLSFIHGQGFIHRDLKPQNSKAY